MVNNYIIFTGLLRREDMLIQSLTDMIGMAEEYNIKQIIIVTWKAQSNAIKNKNRFRQFLKHKLIQYVEYPKLESNGGGNYKAQMFHYLKGLELIPEKDSFVLKTRTDVYIQREMLKNIFTKNLFIGENDNVMNHKIWLPWVEKYRPFYFADECFYSHYSSMRKLYNITKDFHINIQKQGIIHIRRFITPFLNVEEYKPLCDIMMNDIDMNDKLKMEIYHIVLRKYFDVDSPTPTSVIFRDWSKKNDKLNLRHKLHLHYSNI